MHKYILHTYTHTHIHTKLRQTQIFTTKGITSSWTAFASSFTRAAWLSAYWTVSCASSSPFTLWSASCDFSTFSIVSWCCMKAGTLCALKQCSYLIFFIISIHKTRAVWTRIHAWPLDDHRTDDATAQLSDGYETIKPRVLCSMLIFHSRRVPSLPLQLILLGVMHQSLHAFVSIF
jgi:hypothetical protein